LESELKRGFNGKTQSEFLYRAGLPKNYRKLSETDKRRARMSVLKGWYNPQRPDILCTNADKFTQAHYLWCEWYYKPADVNWGTYFYDDMTCKYDIVRATMSSPLSPEEPAKTALHAPRRLGKTQTLIIEQLPLIVINRPFSKVLLSELNADRTEEEIDKIKDQIEDNDRIQRDYGGRGKLWPTNSSKLKWKGTRLDFPCSKGSAIMAFSMGSKQRGRGPIYGVIDDPEDDENTYSRDWRRKFFHKLFSTYMNMFHQGGKIVWIGTIIHGQSALGQAMEGISEGGQTGDEDVVERDTRFDDWHKLRFGMIQEDSDGKEYSIQPERLSVSGFHQKIKAQGLHTVMAELQGTPVTPGSNAFKLDLSGAHGYMHCKGDRPDNDYYLDLKTGLQQPWHEFVDSVRVFSGGDIGDGVSSDSDPGSAIFIGIPPNGVRHVLDCFVRRCYAEHLVEEAFSMFDLWGCEVMGWEQAANQAYVLRIAKRFQDHYNEKGKPAPPQKGVPNFKKDKVQRILALRPVFHKEQVRLPYFGEFVDHHGITHVSVDHPHRAYLKILKDQIRGFTDQGIAGHDDAVDGFEIAMRICAHIKAVEAEPDQDPTDYNLEKWRQAGIDLEPMIPVSHLNERMQQDHDRLLTQHPADDVFGHPDRTTGDEFEGLEWYEEDLEYA